MKPKLAIPDQRMLQLMDWAVKNGIAETENEYWTKIEFARTNISNIKAGRQGFTRNHILLACKMTGANANWILGLEKNMFRENTAKTPVELLRQVVMQLEEKNGKP